METKAIDGRRQAIAKRKGRPSSLDKKELSLPPAIKDPMLLILKSLAEPKMEAIKLLAVLVAYEKCKNWTQVAKWLGISTRTASEYGRTYGSFEELMPHVPQTIFTNTPLPTPSNESAENKEGRIFEAYEKAQGALYHIWQLLELTQKRCANASNLRKAGNCKADPDLENGCFSARLNAADARLESKRLFQEMDRFINAIDSKKGEPETPESPAEQTPAKATHPRAETYNERLSESRIAKAYIDGKF